MPRKRMHTSLHPTAQCRLNVCEQQMGGSCGQPRRSNNPRCTRVELLLAMASVWIVPLAAAQSMPSYEPHVVVVQFEPTAVIADGATETGLQVFDSRAATYNVHSIERVFPFLDHVQPTPKTRRNLLALRRTYYVRFHGNDDSRQVARMLSVAPGVVYAEPVIINRIDDSDPGALVDPNDPLFRDQTYLRHLRLTEAWDEVKGKDGSDPVVIAIVDGGGEWRHDDLRENVWTNPNEVPDNGVDDDGNGFIDDVNGVNFSNGDDSDNDPTGYPQTPDNSNHGTAAAGVANAETDNGVGVSGVAWNVDVMHIHAGCPFEDGFICYGYQGVLYAAANGADIINASWGGYQEEEQDIMYVSQALDLATDMGALVVAAAGNDNLNMDLFPYYPARHPRVLSVGATKKDSRTKASFSNYGKLVNVFAPGVSITSTGSYNAYVRVNGTSYSSPLIAGVAALVKTKFPAITPDALREQVRLASETLDAENPGLAGRLGRGYANALAAIQEPAVPAVRLKRWSWIDNDGNNEIAAGDRVTITAVVVNHLADAQQLTVGLVGGDSYPFIDMTMAEAHVGRLAAGDSANVTLEFVTTSSVPINLPLRFYIHTRDGAHKDEADRITLGTKRSLYEVHQSLKALYISTRGDSWRRNTNWNIGRVPSEAELARWWGVFLSEDFLISLTLVGNYLNGPLPAELGNLSQLSQLSLYVNRLSGSIPSELGNLSQLRQLSLSKNSLTGEIPSELGNLSQLTRLYLNVNSLSGSIPSELGNLSQLRLLNLNGNSLTGEIPSELGNLSQLTGLYLSDNALTGRLPRSLMQLDSLQGLWFFGQDLCAPEDDAFQAWLSSIAYAIGPTCQAIEIDGSVADQTFTEGVAITPLVLPEAAGGTPPYMYALDPALPAGLVFSDSTRTITGAPAVSTDHATYTYTVSDVSAMTASLSFGIDVVSAVSFTSAVADQSFPRTHAIAPLALPAATGGVPPTSYTLAPVLPSDLTFDATTRTISGTPTVVTAAVPYTFKATGANGSTDSLMFSIEVYSPTDAQRDVLPAAFALHGNYPNPFQHTTQIVFDLPWPADVTVDVLDVLGRRMLLIPSQDMAGGWGRSISLSGATLPAGLYMYRVHASTPEGDKVHAGRLVRIR